VEPKAKLFQEAQESFDRDVRKLRRKHLLAKFVINNLTIPEHLPLTAYVPLQVSTGSIYPYTTGVAAQKPRAPVIWLNWNIRTDVEATPKRQREILADVMEYYEVLFGDPEPDMTTSYLETNSLPSTIYRGLGKLNGYRVVIRFEVPWPPAIDCEWKATTKVQYELSCTREKENTNGS